MSMLFSLLYSLAASADTAGSLAINALLVDSVLTCRLTFLHSKGHPLECNRGEPTLPKLMAHHLRSYPTCTHPSMHVTSITVTRTHVCNTVSDAVPALT